MLGLLEENIYEVLAILGVVWLVLHTHLILNSKPIPPPEED